MGMEGNAEASLRVSKEPEWHVEVCRTEMPWRSSHNRNDIEEVQNRNDMDGVWS